MQRLKLLCVAMMAMLTLSVITAAPANAGTEGLNAEVKPTSATFVGNSEKEMTLQVLGNSLVIRGGKVISEGSLDAAGKLGTYHLSCEKTTTSLGGTCTGAGDAA